MKSFFVKLLIVCLIITGAVIGTLNFTTSNAKAVEQDAEWGTWWVWYMWIIFKHEGCFGTPANCVIVTAYTD